VGSRFVGSEKAAVELIYVFGKRFNWLVTQRAAVSTFPIAKALRYVRSQARIHRADLQI
jgi:hypothetical protein